MVRIRSAQSVIVLRWRRSPLALYLASFLYVLKGGILTVVWPWRIMSIGGESLAIGAVGGVVVRAMIYYRFSRSQTQDSGFEKAKRTGGKLPA